MITLLVGTSLLAGIGLGWLGHKAKLRIDRWGENEQEQDLIFQAAEKESKWQGLPVDGSPLTPLKTAH